MKPHRLNALTDSVVAIAITIMVLEIRVPTESTLSALKATAPVFGTYLLSFFNIALFWNNHHHMLATADRVDGRLMWANMVMLFFISLLPFAMRWIDEAGIAPWPLAAYGIVLLGASIGYKLVASSVIRLHPDGTLARAVGGDLKGNATLAGYVLAIGLSFVIPIAAIIIYVLNALVWLIPDRRVEEQLIEEHQDGGPKQ